MFSYDKRTIPLRARCLIGLSLSCLLFPLSISGSAVCIPAVIV